MGWKVLENWNTFLLLYFILPPLVRAVLEFL